MKKTLITIFSILLISGIASAVPIAIDADITVSADDNGVVTITGTDKLVRLVQFCTDEVNNSVGCPNNVTITVTSGKAQLDVEGLKVQQAAFNFQYQDADKWLLIPSAKVKLGKNIQVVPGAKGHRFLYVGPVPAAKTAAK